MMEPGQVHADLVVELLQYHPLLTGEAVHGLLDELFRNAELGTGLFHQGPAGIIDVPVVDLLHQRVQRARLNPQRVLAFKAELGRQRIRRQEADAPDVHRQPVGVLLHDGQRLRAVMLIDTDGEGSADIVRLEELHQIAHALMLGPTLDDGHQLLLGDAGNFQQTLRLLIENPERIFAERLDDARRDALADALDQPGGQIQLDALGGGGEQAFKGIHLHLPAEAGVVHPPALDAQGRARLRAAHMPDHGDEIHLVLAFRPDPEHRVAVFLIMEDHTLQRALQFHRIIEG